MADEPDKDSGPKRPPDAWDRFKTLTPLLQTIVTVVGGAWLTWALSGRIVQALEERKFELANVKEMRDLVLHLQPGTPMRPDSAEADAISLSLFREYAIPPLLLSIQNADEARWSAAEDGLRAVAIKDSEQVARHLLRVLNNHSRLYSWKVHLSAIKLLGDLDCRVAVPTLERYRSEVGRANVDSALAALRTRVREDPGPVENDVIRIQDQLTATLASLAYRPRLVSP